MNRNRNTSRTRCDSQVEELDRLLQDFRQRHTSYQDHYDSQEVSVGFRQHFHMKNCCKLLLFVAFGIIFSMIAFQILVQLCHFALDLRKHLTTGTSTNQVPRSKAYFAQAFEAQPQETYSNQHYVIDNYHQTMRNLASIMDAHFCLDNCMHCYDIVQLNALSVHLKAKPEASYAVLNSLTYLQTEITNLITANSKEKDCVFLRNVVKQITADAYRDLEKEAPHIVRKVRIEFNSTEAATNPNTQRYRNYMNTPQ